LEGKGRLIVGDALPMDLLPHTLAIIPGKQRLVIEADPDPQLRSIENTVEERLQKFPPGELRRYVAGDGEPQVVLICGFFNASFGASINLFSAVPSVITEQFDPVDQLDHKLKSALAELVAQEVGTGAMTAALLKQVLVALLRRALSSNNLWVEQLSILGDTHISRAFAAMLARPGAPHSISSLAQTAGLSRSAFMARFTAAFGHAPMTILRQLRMRHAANLLAANSLSIDQVAYEVGYASRSNFIRAFQKAYGGDPSQYRGGPPRPLN
jgi:AraC family transcriptional regulator, activator of mtrCDE